MTDCTCTYGAYVRPAGGTGWDIAKYDPECPEHGEPEPHAATSDPRPDPRTHPEYWTE